MTKNVENTAGEFNADLAALRQDVAHLAETIGELVQHQTKAAGHRVVEASGEIKASIERNPLTAVLIAFGVGMALGMLSRLRR